MTEPPVEESERGLTRRQRSLVLVLVCLMLAVVRNSFYTKHMTSGFLEEMKAEMVEDDDLDPSRFELPEEHTGDVLLVEVPAPPSSDTTPEATKSPSPVPVTGDKSMKFYILDIPEASTWLTGNFTEEAVNYYNKALNEESGEVWLHRGLEQLSQHRTLDPNEAQVIFIPAYLHFNANMCGVKAKAAARDNIPVDPKAPSAGVPYQKMELAELMLSRVVDKTKPHILLAPTWNPTVSRNVGSIPVARFLAENGVNMYSVGYERNNRWQFVDVDRIIPIPYVVRPQLSRAELQAKARGPRTPNFVFYAGDDRGHAVAWAGCDRKMLLPLANHTNMDVRIVNKHNRLSQEEYNARMDSSEFCLIVCGDTPTSRSLASSVTAGCIPLRIGSRLRGECEPPCHPGFGWVVSHLPHMPFGDQIDWNRFPEVDEAAFAADPNGVLDDLLSRTTEAQKDELKSMLREFQMAFVYGWGSPVTATEFGDAVEWMWTSAQHRLRPEISKR